MPRRRGRSGVTLLVSTKRTAALHSQVTVDFHCQDTHLSTCLQVHHWLPPQVTSPLKTCSRVTVDFHSQVAHLSMCLQAHCDFHSQVTHLSRCLQVHCDFHSQASHLAAVIVPLWTGLPLWHIYFRGAVILLVWAWYCQLVPHVLCVERPLWARFASDSICSDTVTSPFGQGRTLRFPILFVVQVPARTSSSLQSRCHILK